MSQKEPQWVRESLVQAHKYFAHISSCNESEIGTERDNKREIGSHTATIRGRLAYKKIETDLFFYTELSLQACINCSGALENVSVHYNKLSQNVDTWYFLSQIPHVHR